MTTTKDVETFLQSEPNDIEDVRERFLVILNGMIQYTAFSALIRTETEVDAHKVADEMIDETIEIIRKTTQESITDSYLRKKACQ